MKIVLITTTQPAANPRLVKEADALAEAGHDVLVLYCYVADWAQNADKDILLQARWKYKQVGGINKKSLDYRKSRLFFKFFKSLNKLFRGKRFAEQAHARCYNNLLNHAVKAHADWYIGHNPGSMAIVATAARINNAFSGFDFEDYHRGEYVEFYCSGATRQVFLEKKYISQFTYLSASSPLIKEKIMQDLPEFKRPFICLKNTFTLKLQPSFRTLDDEKGILKLFWISQHLGKDRGLEIVISVLKDLNNDNIQLTLAGNYSEEIRNYFLTLSGRISKNIKFAGVISPYRIAEYASNFDIGLALEPAFSVNNNIALSNKIFTYLLAGNAIIFSETEMQNKFNQENKTGLSFQIGNQEALKKCIMFYLDKKETLKQRDHNYKLAQQKFNWNIESQKLLHIIN